MASLGHNVLANWDLEKNYILIDISLKFVNDGPIDDKLSLVQVMTRCWIGEWWSTSLALHLSGNNELTLIW